MPNLLPDWFAWIRPAGRLIWSSGILLIGIGFVVALIKPPRMKRPFPDRVGYALFPAIIVGTLVLGAIITPVQRTIIWLGLAALVGHAMLMVVSRPPHDPDATLTWSAAFAGAVGVFALLLVGYAIFPHEYLTYANSYLQWGDNGKFVFQSNQEILGFIPINYPFSFDYPAVRDIVGATIYIVLVGLNLKFWVMWQQRHDVAPAAKSDDAAPAKRSRFGRPLRRTAAV